MIGDLDGPVVSEKSPGFRLDGCKRLRDLGEDGSFKRPKSCPVGETDTIPVRCGCRRPLLPSGPTRAYPVLSPSVSLKIEVGFFFSPSPLLTATLLFSYRFVVIKNFDSK